MILSEEEARKTQCCGPEHCGEIVATGTTEIVPGQVHKSAHRVCVASKCMGWLWVNESGDETVHAVGGVAPLLERLEDEGWHKTHFSTWGIITLRRDGPPTGRCGLAGKP